MKRPVNWYEDNLKNSLRLEADLTKQILILKEDLARLRKRNEFSTFQITQAHLKGKKEFDAERFCIKRSKE